MDEDLVFLYEAHFGPGPFFDGVRACGEILNFGRKRVIARCQRFINLFLGLHSYLQFAHALPPALAPPQRVLRNGGQQHENNQQQAHGDTRTPDRQAGRFFQRKL